VDAVIRVEERGERGEETGERTERGESLERFVKQSPSRGAF